MMTNSWNLGKIAGIHLRVHWTFLLLPAWICMSVLVSGGGVAAALASVMFVIAVFCCVVLHELGHSLAARRYGISTRDITLLPVGGIASLERMPRNPVQELVIAVAGPAVNVAIAVAAFGCLIPLIDSSGPLAGFLTRLAWINVALVIFNMLPAFPMDGGRVLRAVLALALPYPKATAIATTVGKIIAIGMGVCGIFFGNVMLVLIAVFVYLAADGEATNERRFKETKGAFEAASDEQPSVGPVISAGWNVLPAFRWLSRRPASQVIVIRKGEILGYLTKNELRDAVRDGLGMLRVEDLFRQRDAQRSRTYSS